jgi:hypothetical protein
MNDKKKKEAEPASQEAFEVSSEIVGIQLAVADGKLDTDVLVEHRQALADALLHLVRSRSFDLAAEEIVAIIRNYSAPGAGNERGELISFFTNAMYVARDALLTADQASEAVFMQSVFGMAMRIYKAAVAPKSIITLDTVAADVDRTVLESVTAIVNKMADATGKHEEASLRLAGFVKLGSVDTLKRLLREAVLSEVQKYFNRG